MINFLVVDKIIKEALIEDIPVEDISTNSVILLQVLKFLKEFLKYSVM